MNDLLDDRETCAVRVLEQRLSLLAVDGRRATRDEWEKVPHGVRELIPLWYVNLIGGYNVLGAVLECRGLYEVPIRMFSFFRPSDLAVVLEEDGLGRSLLDYGYFPLANESDGNYWVCRSGEARGAIYLLELSSWDRSEPAEGNGLLFAASRLSYLITSMGISEASYYEDPKGPSRVIWYKEK